MSWDKTKAASQQETTCHTRPGALSRRGTHLNVVDGATLWTG